MKELKNIDKRMPYTEREDYVQQLISQTTERSTLLPNNLLPKAKRSSAPSTSSSTASATKRHSYWPAIP